MIAGPRLLLVGHTRQPLGRPNIGPRHVTLSCTQRVLSRHLGGVAHITVVSDDHLRIVAHFSVLHHGIDVSR